MRIKRKRKLWRLTFIGLMAVSMMLGAGITTYAKETENPKQAEEAAEEIDISQKEAITLQKVEIKKVTSDIKGFTLQWKGTKDTVSGYQIAYSTGKHPEAQKAVKKNVGKTRTRYSFTKLKGNQTYYAWVRSYRTIGGEKIYSPWSDAKKVKTDAYLVVIDAGHQNRANTGKEPNGPGSSVMKMKVTGGTQGAYTGQTEYELNLAVAKKLQTVLKKRGYQVLMVRTSNAVNISNVERAKLANDKKADVFIRIHANGSENKSQNGAMTICQTKNNPYCKATYKKCRKLSDCVLDAIVKNTGCRKEKVWETDTMTGINWCKVPVTIVEMGYLSNQKEDKLLATDSYRKKMAVGIANGIDAYFEK